jgi:hypothetical protein
MPPHVMPITQRIAAIPIAYVIIFVTRSTGVVTMTPSGASIVPHTAAKLWWIKTRKNGSESVGRRDIVVFLDKGAIKHLREEEYDRVRK